MFRLMKWLVVLTLMVLLALPLVLARYAADWIPLPAARLIGWIPGYGLAMGELVVLDVHSRLTEAVVMAPGPLRDETYARVLAKAPAGIAALESCQWLPPGRDYAARRLHELRVMTFIPREQMPAPSSSPP